MESLLSCQTCCHANDSVNQQAKLVEMMSFAHWKAYANVGNSLKALPEIAKITLISTEHLVI